MQSPYSMASIVEVKEIGQSPISSIIVSYC